MNNDNKDSKSVCCKCPCHMMKGLLIALIGLTILLGHLEVISQHIVDLVWPTLLILIGLKASVGKGKCKCCADA